jgi:hypothetical protein
LEESQTVRLDAVARVRELTRALARRARRAGVFVLVLTLLAVTLVVGKNILLAEVGRRIHKSFAYGSLKLSYFPPALVIENFRSLSEPPAVKARRLRIEIPYLALLRNRKILTVVIESPEIHIRPAPPGAPRAKPRPPLSILELPFTIERGLIENGTIVLERGTTTFEAGGVRALVTQDGESFALRATAETCRYISPRRGPTPLGAVTVLLDGKGEDVTVNRLAVEGPGVSFTADGLIRDFFRPAGTLNVRYDVDTDIVDDLLHMPFAWRGRANGQARLERRDGRITFATDFASETLQINEVPMGSLRGRFELFPDKRGELDLGMQKPGRPAEHLTLSFLPGRVEGRAETVFIDPVFREIRIPWPVRSAVWGAFTIASRKIAADVEFRDPSLDRRGDTFPLRGGVKVGVDLGARLIDVEAPGLESSFGRFDATARIDLGGPIDTRIHAQVTDVKQAREFVSLLLRQKFGFAEIRGQGYVDATLSGRSASPDVAIKGTLSPGGYDSFDGAFAEVDLTIARGVFQGRFDVDDPALKGHIEVKSGGGDLEVDVRNGEGELDRVLPALRLPIKLSGRVAGDFQLIAKAGRGQEFTGIFTSPLVKGYGQTASQVAGRLAWKDGVISFPDLAMGFHGGRLVGRLLIGIADGQFDIDARGEELDFGTVVPSASGRLSMSLAGRGVFGRDTLPGLFTIKDMRLSPLDRTEARGELRLGVAGGRVSLGLQGGLYPGENPFGGSFEFPLNGEPFGGVLTGRIADLDLIVPWNGAQGRADYTAKIAETPETVHVSADVAVTAPVMPLPGFAYPVTDFTSSMTYADGVLTVTSMAGKLGGGPLTGSGKVGVGGGISTMDLRFEGRDMVLSPMERMRAQADGSIRILKDPKRFVTEGDILFKRLSWRREIYEGFSFSSQSPTEPSGPSFFDGMSLNLRLRADENVVIENSLGRFNARFNLTRTGTSASSTDGWASPIP